MKDNNNLTHRLYKAEVRKIPNFLTEEAFYQGFNVDMPIDYKYFVHGKSKYIYLINIAFTEKEMTTQ